MDWNSLLWSILLHRLEKIAWTSPLFIYLLLTRISGTPILDRRALEKWGDDSEYQIYRKNTPLLFPRFFKKNES